MGRRWGKTVLGGTVCGNALAQHGRVAWIAPTYKNTRPMWRWLLLATAADVDALQATTKRMLVGMAKAKAMATNGARFGVFDDGTIEFRLPTCAGVIQPDEAREFLGFLKRIGVE